MNAKGDSDSALHPITFCEDPVPLRTSNRRMKTARPNEASARGHAIPGGIVPFYSQGWGAVFFEVIP